jgi:DNA-3-methyladenine glycosylase I
MDKILESLHPHSYCHVAISKEEENPHRLYHDHEYGYPIQDDNEMFGRLLLEINQAGLSWTTILLKKENFRKAYSNFNIEAVARYSEKDRKRLLNDAGIIRNKLKVNAAIHNANQILNLQNDFGSFKEWLDYHHPLTRSEWVKLFKSNFKFTGGEITNEFLLSTGYLEGAHDKNCPIYSKVLILKPMWSVSK